MKKLLSVILAAVMTISVFALSVMPAMAADVQSPTASTAVNKGPITQVNGVNNFKDVVFSKDSNKTGAVTFTYTGEGTLKGWEENMTALGFTKGEDYTAVQNKDGSFTITFLNEDAIAAFENGDLIVNAIVDMGNGTTSVTASTKKNDSSKSPATGISTAAIAGSVAIMGAGIAVLSATKKRDAE